MKYKITYEWRGKTCETELWADDDDTALTKARLYYGAGTVVTRSGL